VSGGSGADIITGAGPGGNPHVEVFGQGLASDVTGSFMALQANFVGGVFVGGN
jgi:hypothetical protein